jgi:DNA-binding SARP family transcriptional activator/tetratricopeptide (TPR) repeat protein/DNA-binding XRE family transcriptional regulator
MTGLLRESRIRAGLTQHELAGRASVSVRTVRALENGAVTRPQAASLRRLAAVLDVDPASLLPGPVADAGPGDSLLRVDVLGPLAVRRGPAVITVASPMLRKLLCLLAIQPGREVGFEEIIDTLWEGQSPRTCRQLVHTYVGGLRKLLDDGARDSAVPRTAQGYRLVMEAGQSDAAEFSELVTRAGRAAADGAALPAWQLYAEAVNCWRGPLLAGAGAWPQVHPAAIALTGRRTAAVLAWAELGLSLGKYSPLVPALRTLAVEQTLHEGLAARLMLALAGAGQQAEALAVYQDLRDRLSGELGVDPGPEITSAHLRVLRGQLPGAGLAAAAGPRVCEPPAQLPMECVGFTGRAGELRTLDRILGAEGAAKSAPVAVVTGMGGVGKTALAVRWAWRQRGRYPDGQLYADLRGHAVTGPARPLDVLTGFLAALGEPAERIPVDEGQAAALLRTRLEGRRILLLLDNALDAQQVRPLLPAAPGSAVIVTARDRMTGLIARDGAGAVVVRPLPEAEAAALLVASMGERGGGEPPAVVAELAGLCAHLPLALRIAAANLAARPSYRLADYVATLASGDRLTGLAVPEDEQAAVRLAFELSCDTLKPELRRLFRLAGLVPGPDFTAPAVAALAGIATSQAESLLDRLAARNLIDEHAHGRYRLHDLLRLYAAELAAAEESAAGRDSAIDRLAAYAMAAVRSASEMLYPHLLHLPDNGGPDNGGPDNGGPDNGEGERADGGAEFARGAPEFTDDAGALAWLNAERANLVALVALLAQQGGAETALRLSNRLAGYFQMTSNSVDWLVVATAARRAVSDDVPIAVACAELHLGTLRSMQSRYEAAAGHFAACADRARCAGWVAGEAVALNNQASAYWQLGRAAETIELLTEALDAHRRTGRTAGEAVTVANIAAARLQLARAADEVTEAAAVSEQRHEALRLLGQARDMHQALRDRRNEAETCRRIAEAYRDLGDLEPAAAHARQAITLAREAAVQRFEISARSTLATVLVRLGEPEQGLAEHTLAQDLAGKAGDPAQQAEVLMDLGESMTRLGRLDEALLIAQDVSAAADQLRMPLLQRRAKHVIATTASPELSGQADAAKAAAGHRKVNVVPWLPVEEGPDSPGEVGLRLGGERDHPAVRAEQAEKLL